jgi:very-short-patch-repair endonuclease
MPVHDFIAKGKGKSIENEFEAWLSEFDISLSFQDIRKKSLYEAVEIIVSKFLSPTLSKGKGDIMENRTDEKVQKLGYLTGGNYSHLSLEKAKKMRKIPTNAEKILWAELKSKSLDYKFRQQHLINDFIVDFVCLSKKLIIEVDGEYHFTEEQIHLDTERTSILNKLGYKVIRFKNEEVTGTISTVLEKIKSELLSQKSIFIDNDSVSSPSPSGRVGEGIKWQT